MFSILSRIIRSSSVLGRTAFGRLFVRLAAPLGVVMLMGDVFYMGLKYSGILAEFKKLYCSNCSQKIDEKMIMTEAEKVGIGQQFSVQCACGHSYTLTNEGYACEHCKQMLPVDPQELEKTPIGNRLFVTCTGCGLQRGIIKK